MPVHSASNRARAVATRFVPPFDPLHPGGQAPTVEIPVVRVRRAPAVAELRVPPLAVWAGEVVLVAGDARERLPSVTHALHACARGRVHTITGVLCDEPDAFARTLAASVSAATAVVVAVPLVPDAFARQALEALRRAVARVAPCRCVWVVHGRAHPW